MIGSFLLRLFFTIPILGISFGGYSKPIQLPDSTEVVFKDTIHVHGKVVDEKGNPLRAIEVSSGYYRGLVSTFSNSDGYFLLQNVQPNDTIFFSGGNRFAKIFNEGSRILNMTLPELRRRSLEGIMVTAKRPEPRQPKKSITKFENLGGIFDEPDAIEPEPYGGYIKFEKTLQAKLSYPEKAKNASIEGIVKIEFVINREGKPINFSTNQGLGYGCEEAVVDVLKETKWKPGINNGSLFYPTMSVKVLFKLEDK